MTNSRSFFSEKHENLMHSLLSLLWQPDKKKATQIIIFFINKPIMFRKVIMLI
ncbi:hypothetical protein ACVLVH_004635 [Kluyvera sp. 1366]